MAKRLLGKEVTAALNEKIKAQVAELQGKGVNPTLCIIRVGENESDISYERGATKRCETLGVACEKILLPADVSQEELLAVIDKVNKDPTDPRRSAVPSAAEASESVCDRECSGSGKGCRLHDRWFHVRRIHRQERRLPALHTAGLHGDSGLLRNRLHRKESSCCRQKPGSW